MQNFCFDKKSIKNMKLFKVDFQRGSYGVIADTEEHAAKIALGEKIFEWMGFENEDPQIKKISCLTGNYFSLLDFFSFLRLNDTTNHGKMLLGERNPDDKWDRDYWTFDMDSYTAGVFIAGFCKEILSAPVLQMSYFANREEAQYIVSVPWGTISDLAREADKKYNLK